MASIQQRSDPRCTLRVVIYFLRLKGIQKSISDLLNFSLFLSFYLLSLLVKQQLHLSVWVDLDCVARATYTGVFLALLLVLVIPIANRSIDGFIASVPSCFAMLWC